MHTKYQGVHITNLRTDATVYKKAKRIKNKSKPVHFGDFCKNHITFSPAITEMKSSLETNENRQPTNF